MKFPIFPGNLNLLDLKKIHEVDIFYDQPIANKMESPPSTPAVSEAKAPTTGKRKRPSVPDITAPVAEVTKEVEQVDVIAPTGRRLRGCEHRVSYPSDGKTRPDIASYTLSDEPAKTW